VSETASLAKVQVADKQASLIAAALYVADL